MDNSRLLLKMAHGLSLAAAQRDWAALAALDAELARLLLQLGPQAAWPASQREAVDALRVVHRDVWQDCQRESGELARRIAGLHARRDGWLAYAMNEGIPESAS